MKTNAERARGRTWDLTFIPNTRRKMSRRQKENYRELFDAHGIRFDARPRTMRGSGDDGSASDEASRMKRYETLDWDRAFPGGGGGGEPRRRVLELGCGLGDNLIAAAIEFETYVFLGVEVHRPGVATALGEIEARGLTNAKVCEMDALWLMTGEYVEDASIDECLVHFPDPWRDESGLDRKAHRRIVNETLLTSLERTLRPGTGRLSVATDDDQYARHLERVFEQFARPRGWVRCDPFARFDSKYASRALEEGRSCVDVGFRFHPPSVDVA